ncbi:hypothetical protein [Burkholderia anthina]|uniref:hypothetical protein n=1 Tax=Burkholderia anthina TaxID=179879 RepID=UPI001589EB38|nr:hypothetical protein [Burkholderia anthina]
MTTQNEKSPAPKQASEATAQRPSTENPTAEGIVGVRAACGNQTSSKVSRADALTPLLKSIVTNLNAGLPRIALSRAETALELLAASPVEQHDAAPADEQVNPYADKGSLGEAWRKGFEGGRPLAAPGSAYMKAFDEGKAARAGIVQPEPPVADERAAFAEWCERFPEITSVERLRDAWKAARASSPNAAAEGATVGAWRTEDGRAISAEQKAGMLRDGGAGASSVQPYSIPCYLGAAPARVAEEGKPVAWVRFRSDGGFEGPIMDSDERMCDVRRTSGAWTPLFARPAQAAEPVAIPQPVLDALRFYAHGHHYDIDSEHQQFDTVSGEPANWLFSERDDDCTMIEDGSIAKAALCGGLLGFEEPEKPLEGEVFTAAPPTPAPASAPVGLTDEQIVQTFESEIKNDPDAYTRPGECVYQITARELVSGARALLEGAKQ